MSSYRSTHRRFARHAGFSSLALLTALASLVALEGCSGDADVRAPEGRTRADTFDATSPYRADGTTSIALDAVPEAIRARVVEFVAATSQETENGNAWQGAVLAPRAVPVFRPDMQEAAYFEIKILVDGAPKGFVLASTGAHDAPIAGWSTAGMTLLEGLAAQPALARAARFYRLDALTLAAEDADGRLASIDRDARVAGQRVTADTWLDMKLHYANILAPKLARMRRDVAPLWAADARNANAVTSTSDASGASQPMLMPIQGAGGLGGGLGGGGPTHHAPVCTYDWARKDNASDANPPTPHYDQYIDVFDGVRRYSGCSPTAASIILGWISHQRAYTQTGGEWTRAGLETAFRDWTTQQVWVPPHKAPPPGVCIKNPAACDIDPTPGHFETRTFLTPVSAPDTNNARVNAIVADVGRAMKTHAGDPASDGVPAGSTHTSDILAFSGYLTSNGIPVNMWHNASGDWQSRFASITDSLHVHHAPVMVDIPGHTEVIDAEKACSDGFETVIYERVNRGWGGYGDYWAPRLGGFLDEIEEVFTFTAAP